MTATLDAPTTTALPDPAVVISRADKRWRQETEDPAVAPDRLAALAEAVREQVLRPLLSAPDRAGAAATDELARLRADNATLADQLSQAQRELAEAHSGLATAQQRAAQVDSARAAARAELASAQATIGFLEDDCRALQQRVAELEGELTEARAALETAQASARQAAPHRHLYERVSPDEDPQPCACGHPWPRTPVYDEDDVAPAPPPWEALFDRLRGELGSSGWTEATS